MGEGEFKSKGRLSAVESALADESVLVTEEMRLSTPGGRCQVRWDDNSSATALGQLAFFAEFLEVSRLFEPSTLAAPVNRRFRAEKRQIPSESHLHHRPSP